MEDDLDGEDWAELMAEPPVENFGWKRSLDGGWSSLEAPPRDRPKPFNQGWSEAVVKHGTPGGYVTYGCRCVLCVGWKRGYDAARRPSRSAKK